MYRVVADEFFRHCARMDGWIFIKQSTGLVLICPVAGDDEDLIIQKAPECIDRVILLQQRFKDTVGNDSVFMAQADQFLIIVEDRVGIREGGTGVDLCVIWIDHDPGSAGSEACILSAEMTFSSVTYCR